MAYKGLRIKLVGTADLRDIPIPQSWIGKDSIFHLKTYNISERDLDSLRKRVLQESYNNKNPEREVEQLPFEDPFRQNEWFRIGSKDGRFGEYWNPSKLDLLQQYKEENLFVREDYIPMKEVKKFLGCSTTLEKVKNYGFDVCFGKKKGKRGTPGWFVTPDIMQIRRSTSASDGVIPVGQVFNKFPNLSDGDLKEIVETNEEAIRPRKFHHGEQVSRQDFVVSTEPLNELNKERNNPKKKLRSRSVTSADVLGNAAKLRKMLSEQRRELKTKEQDGTEGNKTQ